MARKRGKAQREWVNADSALWRTLHILTDISQEKVPRYSEPTLFPLKKDEVAFASGPLMVECMRSNVNGSYVHNPTIAFGDGGLGFAFTAQNTHRNPGGHANPHNLALAQAHVMWRRDFEGTVTVTNLGFYLHSSHGLHWWRWEVMAQLRVAEFSCLIFHGESPTGTRIWRIFSDWSELIFVLWALNIHPQHPQLVEWSWVPPGWIAWATSVGHAPPLPHTPAEHKD